MAFYRIILNGIIPYPGEIIDLDDVFVSKFNFEEWEPETGGIEFDLPSELFDKPYQSDDFEVEIIEDVHLDAVGTIVLSSSGALVLQNYWDDSVSGSFVPFIWVKHLKLVIDSRPIFNAVSNKWEVGFINSSIDYGVETDEIYIHNTSTIRYTITKYNKTKVGVKVRVFEDRLKNGVDIIRFAGRVSEPPKSSIKGLLNFTAKDEFDCLDIEVPEIISSKGVLTIYSFLSQNSYYQISETTGYLELVSGRIFNGESANLTWLGRHIFETGKPEFSESVIDPDKNFSTFKDFFIFYMKVTQQFLYMDQWTPSTSSYPQPLFRLKQFHQLNDQFFNIIEAPLLGILSVDSSIECELSNGLSAVEVSYQGDNYRINNVLSSNYGEYRSFTLDIPDGVSLVSNGGNDFSVYDFASVFMSIFGVIYQRIKIESDSRIDVAIEAGGIYRIGSDDQEAISEFVEAGLSDVIFCTSRSENVFEFIHIKDTVLNPISPYCLANEITGSSGLFYQLSQIQDFNVANDVIDDFQTLAVDDTGYLFYPVGTKLIFEEKSGSSTFQREIISITSGGIIELDSALGSSEFWVYYVNNTTSGILSVQEDWFYFT